MVPPGVVTSTFLVPVPSGVVQVAVVALVALKVEHSVPPTLIAVAPVRFSPVIVILVLPASGPLTGDTPVTVGSPKKVTCVVWVIATPSPVAV